jgi:hypothetical protein
MRKAIALISALLAACTASGPPGFEASAVRTNAPAGVSSMTTATLKGKVTTGLKDANLTVAVVGVDQLPGKDGLKRTVGSSRLQNGRYSISLPAIPSLESEQVVGFHELWTVILFNDVNGNGEFDRSPPVDRLKERDIELPLIEHFRMAYKGYGNAGAKFPFLPNNDFMKGWVLVVKIAGTPSSYHQDLTRDWNLTASR